MKLLSFELFVLLLLAIRVCDGSVLRDVRHKKLLLVETWW